jgi:hypothetical protein
MGGNRRSYFGSPRDGIGGNGCGRNGHPDGVALHPEWVGSAVLSTLQKRQYRVWDYSNRISAVIAS